jgi:hypothetical protein
MVQTSRSFSLAPLGPCDTGTDCESVTALLELRWFAAHKRVEALRVDCEILREVVESAHLNWRSSLIELARMEAAREALADEIARQDAQPVRQTNNNLPCLEAG